MKKQTSQKTEYILNEEETEVIKHCLSYCLHRLKKHPSCGISKVVNEETVDKLRKEFLRKEFEEPCHFISINKSTWFKHCPLCGKTEEHSHKTLIS